MPLLFLSLNQKEEFKDWLFGVQTETSLKTAKTLLLKEQHVRYQLS